MANYSGRFSSSPEALSNGGVAINPRVRRPLAGAGEACEATLVCPVREDSLFGRISKLSPVGSALLGKRAGETIGRNGLDGPRRSATVQRVPCQPEASGCDL